MSGLTFQADSGRVAEGINRRYVLASKRVTEVFERVIWTKLLPGVGLTP
jgi:hypothetical protein